tara:strand:- start:198 stop:1031 length:834 start_codon:yes stop_codon:yes gene_type:complete
MGFFREINGLEEVEQFETKKVSIQDTNGRSIPGVFSLQRTDTNKHLSVVKESYRPIQMDEMFEIIDKASTEIGNIEHTGWAESRAGRKMVLRSRLLSDIDLGGDIIQPHFYTVIDNTGMGSNKSIASTMRVACDNAMHLIDTEEAIARTLGVRHALTFDGKIEAMIDNIRSNVNTTIKFGEVANKLRIEKFSREDMVKLTGELIPVTDKDSTKRINKREKLVELFNNGRGNVGESKWDALNAVTEYETHTGKQSTEKFLRSFNSNTISQRASKLLVA